MNTSSGKRLTSRLLSSLLLVLGALVGLSGCGKQTQSSQAAGKDQPTGNEQVDVVEVIKDKQIPEFQIRLLDLGFEAATAIPVNPHIKSRSKTQELVVTAALTLDQPQRSLGYIPKIVDWRRGACLAELSFYLLKNGYTGSVQQHLDMAEKFAQTTDDWRRDSIRVKIAKSYQLMGNHGKVEELTKGLVDSESGKLPGVKTVSGDDVSLEEQMKALDALIAGQNFDITKNALDSYAQLYNRFFADAQHRVMISEKIQASWNPMPIIIRVEILNAMARFAIEHQDLPEALALVNQSQGLFEAEDLPLPNELQMAGVFARLRYEAGDHAKARADADAALKSFDEQGDTIFDIYRAGVLRPLAEAYQAMGDQPAALSVYKKAIEEGVRNPNSRPRAEDLAATCCSLALNAVEPDAEMWTKLQQIKEELGQPW